MHATAASFVDNHLDELERAIIPNRRLKIYFASKIHHAPIVRQLSGDWNEFDWTQRWPFLHVGRVPDNPVYAKLFWLHDEEDVAKADVVLVYGTYEDNLRGALVEAGMALGLGKEVVVVGDNPNYGTWQYHPRVHRTESLLSARAVLRVLAL